ncbi:hypothetical protein ACRHK7_01265 [Weissella tructae]|uniref:hypothetical protein n=1 Tax=Weissella tructae TaxID=887702 RepID=UPI003D8A03DF
MSCSKPTKVAIERFENQELFMQHRKNLSTAYKNVMAKLRNELLVEYKNIRDVPDDNPKLKLISRLHEELDDKFSELEFQYGVEL